MEAVFRSPRPKDLKPEDDGSKAAFSADDYLSVRSGKAVKDERYPSPNLQVSAELSIEFSN